MTKPVPTHNLTGKPLGDRPDREKTEEILQRLRQAANDRHADGFAPGAGDDQAQALENVLFPSAQEKTGSRFPMLIAVFMVSAIAGGAVAGLYLARNGGKPPVLEVAGAKPAEMVMEKDATPQESGAASTASTAAAGVSGSGKDQAQLVAEVRPAGDTVAGAAEARPVAPPPLDNGTTLEKTSGSGTVVTERMPAAPTATAETAPAPAGDTAAAADGEMARTTTPVVQALEQQTPQAVDFHPATEKKEGGAASGAAAANADGAAAQSPDELKALTDNVVQALGALIPGGEGAPETANTSDLRMALSALVDRAMQEGRSKNEIISILDKAIEEAGAENVPEELLGPDGKVDLNLLIASVIPKDMETVSSQDRSYVKQLLAEERNTSLKGRKSPQERKSRFYTRKGKRYTRIRRGDTLAQIAYDAYGDALAYPRILRANSGRLAVRNLRPGMEIRVPARSEKAADSTEPASLVQGTGKVYRKAASRKATARKTAGRKATVRKRTTRRTAARKKVVRRRQAAVRRKQPEPKPKITDRLLGVIGAGSVTQQSQASAASQAKPEDEPTVTTNFQRYKLGTPPAGN